MVVECDSLLGCMGFICDHGPPVVVREEVPSSSKQPNRSTRAKRIPSRGKRSPESSTSSPSFGEKTPDNTESENSLGVS